MIDFQSWYKRCSTSHTGNFLTLMSLTIILGLDEYAIRNKILESQTTKLNTKTSETVGQTNDANTKKPKLTRQKESRGPKLKNVVNTGQREGKPVWDNTKRVNHQNFSKYPHLSKTFVPSGVLTRTGLHRPSVSTARPVCTARPSVSTARPVCTARPSVSTARPVCTARPSVSTARPVCTARPSVSTARPVCTARPSVSTASPVCTARPSVSTASPVCTARPSLSIARFVYATRPIYPRMDNVRPRGSCLPIKRSYYTKPAFRPKDLKQDVKTFGVQNMTTAGTRAVVNTSKGKLDTDLKKLRWVWRPKGNYLDHVSKDSGSFMLKKVDFKLLDESQVVLRAPRKDDVYSLDLKNIVPSEEACHLVRGLPSKVFVNDHTCVACKKGKQHKASCKAKLERIIRKPLELLHMDLFRPVSGESINKKRYCLVVADDFSRFSWVFFLATMDETSEILCNLIIGLENQSSHNVKIIRCDNGTEFKNHAMNEFCAKKGIKMEFSVARTLQQNGVAERKNRTLIKAARTMLADLLLPIPFWAEAVKTACYVLNRVLVIKPQNKTPYELLIGKSHSISFMRPFGCPLTILNTLDSLGKFDGKSDEGYLLGYSTSSKAFRVYNKRTKRVEENLHINFLEDQPNVTGTGPNWMFDLDFLTNSMNYIPVSVENQVNVDAGTQDSYVAGSSGKDKGPTQEYILLPLQPHRTRIPVEDVPPAAHEKPSESSPKENDVQDSEDAANKESEQDLQDELEKMVTQELAAKAMDDVSRQAFEEEKRRIASQKKAAQATSTNKLSTDRPSVSTDRPSVSTDRPFVSTDRSNTPYVSAASTPTGANAGESSFVYLGGKIPIDASTLPNADLPIDPNMPDYMKCSDTSHQMMEYSMELMMMKIIHKDHPKGQILGDPTSAVQTRGKIQKAFYRHNTSLEEPKTISQALQDESWVEAMQEELLQFKLQKVWVLVDLPYGKKEEGIDYDEVFAPVSRIEAIRMYAQKIPDEFMGELTFFLGLQVKQQPDGIFISQDKYVADILKKFDFWSIRTATTLIESNKPLVKDEDGVDVYVHVYRSMIGSIMYLIASRPDIMFAVCACARFQVTPKASHLNAVKKIFRYLKHQPKLGLWYPKDSPFELESYSNSDYGGASLDKKSTTGGCQFLGRRLIYWQCKKQTIMANSTTEAEYVAAANCCRQVLWIQNQIMDYGFNFMNTKIHIDNESNISVIKNHVAHSRTKHIKIRFHFKRDCYEKRLIEVIKIYTDHNVADLLTKEFDVTRFNFLVVSIGLLNLYLGFRESLERDIDGTEELLLPDMLILWLTKVSTDSAKLVPLGKDSTAIKPLEKIPPRV
ncbi:putative ribonuclease H-like domain-containing protein [Tanacetum coccineum]